MSNDDLRTLNFHSPGGPLHAQAGGGLWHILSHASGPFHVRETVSLGASEEGAEDLAIAERLLGVFLRMLDHQQNALPREKVAASGIWEMSRHAFHGEFYALVAERDVPGIARYMRNAMQTKLTHGLGPGQQVHEAMAAGGGGLEANVVLILDRLASLAESLGVRPVENPEQGLYGSGFTTSASNLVRQIEQALGYRIGRQRTMGAFGVLVEDQVFDARVPDDVYSAERIKTVMQHHGLRSVAEIGGGLGGSAVQAIRAGLGEYTVFDLPVILLVQGWLLMKAFGTDAVEMFSETAPNAIVFLRPYWEFPDRSREFGLVFNRDSLPEIPEQHAMAYISEIADRGCTLLSINQESMGSTDSLEVRQLWVNGLVRREPRLRCVGRHPYWNRKGYVEELFVPTAS